jgi:hypothetical protein
MIHREHASHVAKISAAVRPSVNAGALRYPSIPTPEESLQASLRIAFARNAF